MLSIGWQESIVIILIAGGIIVLPAWMIFFKAGYPGILSLLMLVPGVNVFMWFFLGFSDWPARRELNTLRQRISSAPPPFPEGGN